MKKFVSYLLFTLIYISYHGQEIPISSSTLTTCEGFLVDTGLSASDYSPNENFTMVICAETDTIVNLHFNFFGLGTGDNLTIYDGSDISAPLIGTFEGDDLQQVDITSTNPGGCLTLVWTTDGEDEGSFGAEISCGAPCIPPLATVTVDDTLTNTYLTCPGNVLTFDASPTIFSNGAQVASWEWDFGDETVVSSDDSWPIITHVFEEPGGYFISLTVTDDNDCTNTNVIDLIVFASTDPVWTEPSTDTYCLGEGEQIFNGGVDVLITNEILDYEVGGIPIPVNFGGLEGGELFIPDDQTECFDNTVTVDAFAQGTEIENIEDIENFFINFEHSFMGDITITFICPNGQSIAVHTQGGGGTWLGEPVDDDNDLSPGVGYDYWWAPDADLGTWEEEAVNVTTLPSGTYSSVQPFDNLIGCPVNGTWGIEICDLWGSDNGFIFDWSIEFNPDLYPEDLSPTPIYGSYCDSTYFVSEYFNQDPDTCGINWINPITEAGEIPVVVYTTNNFGCTYSDTISFFVYDDPIASAGEDYSLCEVGEIAELNGSSSSEHPELGDYSYIWSPSTYLNNDTILNPVLDSTAVGSLIYYLTVVPVDHPLCSSTDSVQVTIFPTIPPVILPEDGMYQICSNGTVELSVSPIYSSYEWDNNPALDTNTVEVAPGLHEITVYFDPSCPFNDTITITPLPEVDFEDHLQCGLNYFINDNEVNITGTWNYTTEDGGEIEFTNPLYSLTALTATDQGHYALTFTDDCGLSDNMDLTILLPPMEEDYTILPMYTPCTDESPLLLKPNGSNSDFYFWQWNFDFDSNSISDESSILVDESGTYTYTVFNECGSNEDTTHVEFIKCDLEIPNIFTPDQRDTLNNSFVIDGLQFFPGSHLAVYNRWGNVVYESNDYKNDWSPKAEEIADGTYFWVLNAKRKDGTTDDYSGYVQIVRKP